jgi:hypothetical protein
MASLKTGYDLERVGTSKILRSRIEGSSYISL